ncbi:MAG: BsuBI/PstI family type II restriction endonuclease [Anaeromyxobacteraceae bacterium]
MSEPVKEPVRTTGYDGVFANMPTSARTTRFRPAARPADDRPSLDWLVDSVEVARGRVVRTLDPDRRAELGQYLTPATIARFMAGMVEQVPDVVRILDAGAGVGSLTAAVVADLCTRGKKPRAIEVTVYDLDPVMVKALHATVALCQQACRAAGVRFKATVLHEDFVQSASEMVEGGLLSPPRPEFHLAILNPPYRKIRSNSAERVRLQAAGLEATNLYTGFLYLAAHLLVPDGEMVAITPRSFCNGPYHRAFRRAFFDMMRLTRLHVFESRDKAFGEDEVLQENVILHAVKAKGRSGSVHITSNASPDDPDVAERVVPYGEVVGSGDDDHFVHIVADEANAAVARQMARMPASLADLDLAVSTGRVVDFRAREHLRKEPVEGTAPLVYPGHLVDRRVVWPKPGFRKWNALSDQAETASLMVPAGTYVLVKRFSAKEEPRRVVAAVIRRDDAPHPRWGFENHLNYFHQGGKELPDDLARGLAAYLNSTMVDTFFRQFSGHTQVNATDLRGLPYPRREDLERLGRRIGGSIPTQDDLDLVVEEVLGMAGDDDETGLKGEKRVEEAMSVLRQLGVPEEQQNLRSALTLLALLDLKPTSRWASASSPLRGITEMMDYFADHFGKRYAPNSRETVRRFTIHQFVEAGFVLKNPDKPERPVNSPQAVYQVEAGALELFRSFGTPAWSGKLASYLKAMPSLTVRYAREREMERIPVKLPSGKKLTLSPGGQNELIKLIVEEFCPRFTPGGEVMYLGDADQKWACFDEPGLTGLGVNVDAHGKMPDAVVFFRKKNWLVLVEAVTSHGPVNPKRRDELKALFAGCKAGLVFVTAFLSRPAMVRYLNENLVGVRGLGGRVAQPHDPLQRRALPGAVRVVGRRSDDCAGGMSPSVSLVGGSLVDVAEPLIFSAEQVARARARPEARRSLLDRWALVEGDAFDLGRIQLEEAALLVPERLRPRLLGPLRADDAKQSMAALGMLLLAKTLHGHGWEVEFEPEIDGLTPDLRLRKGPVCFIVEVRHVAGPLGVPDGHQRLRAELRSVRARTPAQFSTISIDGRKSLKGFFKFLKDKILAGDPGPHVYQEPGILIRFKLLPAFDEEVGVFFAYSPAMAISIDDAPAVRAALNEKLTKYRFSHIIALQGIDTGGLFRAVDQVLFGTEVFVVPIGPERPADEVRIDRRPDAAVWKPDADGARMRQRLDAVLPFEVGMGERGFHIQARVMANPARPHVTGLDSFRPIPALVHADGELMRYVGPGGDFVSEGETIRDYFVP